MSQRVNIALPLFGGADAYLDTLESILSFVDMANPSETELLSWFKNEFPNVESDYSINRRLSFLKTMNFLRESDAYHLGPAGDRFLSHSIPDVVFNVFNNRIIGFDALLLDVQREASTIPELVDHHEQDYDQIKWKVNWMVSMGLVVKNGEEYVVTKVGESFIDAYMVKG